MTEGLYTYKATIIAVYDGDTVTAQIDLGFYVHVVEKIRLFGIDTPELRGAERAEGLRSRDFLRTWILNKEVLIKTKRDKKGKYGRFLGTIYIKDGDEYVDINAKLVEDGLAIYREY